MPSCIHPASPAGRAGDRNGTISGRLERSAAFSTRDIAPVNDENGGRVFTPWSPDYPVMKRTALVPVIVVGLALAATVAVGGAAGTATQADASANASFGAEVSSFMQASSAEADGEVGAGMFEAALNRTDDSEARRQVIENRQAELRSRQERLQVRQAALEDSSGVQRAAIATEVAVGAAELSESANRTHRAAAAAGLDTTALAELRANASEMHGRAVAELARSLTGSPVVGPPETRPGGGNGSAAGGPAADGGNTSDASTDGGDGGNDGGGGGPPEDTGGADAGSDTDAETDDSG